MGAQLRISPKFLEPSHHYRAEGLKGVPELGPHCAERRFMFENRRHYGYVYFQRNITYLRLNIFHRGVFVDYSLHDLA